MLRKCAMVMLLISIANLAQASRLPAVLDKAAAAVKRAGLRASTTVGDKRKQFSQTLAALRYCCRHVHRECRSERR